MIKLCQIIAQLIDYIDANPQILKPTDMFQGFVNALYNGTFDEKEKDPSLLCWFPSNAKTVNPKLHMLEEFSDWMVRKNYIPSSLSPWTVATTSAQRLNWITWYRQNQFSFLGHLGDYQQEIRRLGQSKRFEATTAALREGERGESFSGKL